MTYKVPICKRSDYTIHLQETDGLCWVHCDVRQWSTHIARQMRKDWDALFEMHGGPVFALNEPTGDVKHQKFMRHMGFQFFKTLPANDGGECLIYRRGSDGA